MQHFQKKLHSIISDLIHGIELPENTSINDFADNVIESYLADLAQNAVIVPASHKKAFIDEVRAETLEIVQKITYGHGSLSEYQKKKFSDKT